LNARTIGVTSLPGDSRPPTYSARLVPATFAASIAPASEVLVAVTRISGLSGTGVASTVVSASSPVAARTSFWTALAPRRRA
jgi:hypothetical protein